MKKSLLIIIFLIFGIMAFGNEFSFEIEKGENWEHNMKILFFNKKLAPQIAIWTENSEGKYLETYYISKKVNKWRNMEKKKRQEALPVWWNKVEGNVDAVAGATISGNNAIYREKKAKGNILYIYLEINNSFDYNKYYTKKGENNTINSKVSGQPSLIYLAKFNVKKNDIVEFKLIGHGSPDGTNGNINNDLSKVTNALKILKSAKVKLRK